MQTPCQAADLNLHSTRELVCAHYTLSALTFALTIHSSRESISTSEDSQPGELAFLTVPGERLPLEFLKPRPFSLVPSYRETRACSFSSLRTLFLQSAHQEQCVFYTTHSTIGRPPCGFGIGLLTSAAILRFNYKPENIPKFALSQGQITHPFDRRGRSRILFAAYFTRSIS